MFVGHALLAFSLVAGAAALGGSDRRRALALGLAAGAFAAAPDVDMAYALVGVAGAGTAAPLAVTSAFWATGNAVHRAVTHSLLVAPPAALAAAAWTAGRRGRRGADAAALAVLAVLVAAATAASGPLAGAVMLLFGGTVVGIATLLVRRTALGSRDVLATALVGLATHPFGDLFTGTPPAFLYPLETAPTTGRVALAADPTLHLLGAFGLELATAWLAVLVVARLSGARIPPAPRATVGVGYAAALPVLPAPTLDLSYPFVFGVLAVGLLATLPGAARGRVGTGTGTGTGTGDGGESVSAPSRASRAARATLTALTAVTLAWAAYAAAYTALVL